MCLLYIYSCCMSSPISPFLRIRQSRFFALQPLCAICTPRAVILLNPFNHPPHIRPCRPCKNVLQSPVYASITGTGGSNEPERTQRNPPALQARPHRHQPASTAAMSAAAREIISYIDASHGAHVAGGAGDVPGAAEKDALRRAGPQPHRHRIFHRAGRRQRRAPPAPDACARRRCKDANAREMLYRRIIDSHQHGRDSNYLILLAADAYDVPYRGKRRSSVLADGSGRPYSSTLSAAICPVKAPTLELRYDTDEHSDFHSQLHRPHRLSRRSWASSSPPLTTAPRTSTTRFFTARTPRSCIHEEVIDAVFRRGSRPCPPRSRRTCVRYGARLIRSQQRLQLRCGAVRPRAAARPHSGAQGEPRPRAAGADASARSASMLSEQRRHRRRRPRAFQARVPQKQYGENAALNPKNTHRGTGKFQITTPEVKITVSPEYSYHGRGPRHRRAQVHPHPRRRRRGGQRDYGQYSQSCRRAEEI